MEILDIHTHGEAPKPGAVIALGLEDLRSGVMLLPGQAYSVGIHPWETQREVSEEMWQLLEAAASRPEVVAIGECGVDATPKGGPMFRQLLIFRRHVEISERLHKPIVLHDVKGDDIIVGLRRDLSPKQNWCIHGFRKKEGSARMLLRAGCWLSFGAMFNPDALKNAPKDRILAETDTSDIGIADVICRLEAARGEQIPIAVNTENFLTPEI